MTAAQRSWQDSAGDPVPDFPKRLRAWSAHLEVGEGASLRTISKYRSLLIRFYAETLRDPTAPDLTEEEIVSYIRSLPKNGTSRGEMLRAIKSYCRWAVGRRREDNPAAHLKILRPRPRPKPLIPIETVRLLLRAAFRAEPRRGWALLLAASTGARCGSLVALRASDVYDGLIWFAEAKGGRTYSVPLNRAAGISVEHLRQGGHETLLGVGGERVRQWMRDAARDAGVADVLWHPHQLRDYYATRLIRLTDPDTWRRLMGHADLSQMPLYVAADESRKRAAVEALYKEGPCPRFQAHSFPHRRRTAQGSRRGPLSDPALS